MALFGKDKKEENKKENVTDVKSATIVNLNANDLSHVLISPRMSEKAMLMTEKGVYVFNVSKRANKKQIAKAIKLKYKVTPVKVAVSSIKRKRVRNMRTGVPGVTKGGKKAYVYLKKGDSISLV